MMLDKKANLSGFLIFEFKMGRKAAEGQLATSTMHLARELLTNIRVQWWFRKFCKENKSLEDERSGQPSEVENDQLRASSKLILYNYTRSCRRTQCRPF